MQEAGLESLPANLAPQTAPGVWESVLRSLPPARQVLNAGAGRGGMSLLLHRRGMEVTSIDLHPAHFAAPGMTCQEQDLLQPLKFGDGSFDLVLAVEVLEHLENPWHFFREAIRVLRVGGHFVFTSPNVLSLPSRLSFLRTGLLHYFRDESFRGCYHVTPIFEWSVERCCATTSARLDKVMYSRVGWPSATDVPRHYLRRPRRLFWRMLRPGKLFGEIAIYHVAKTADAPIINLGTHEA
jgi:SAM-dependent methyltransferase